LVLGSNLWICDCTGMIWLNFPKLCAVLLLLAGLKQG